MGNRQTGDHILGLPQRCTCLKGPNPKFEQWTSAALNRDALAGLELFANRVGEVSLLESTFTQSVLGLDTCDTWRFLEMLGVVLYVSVLYVLDGAYALLLYLDPVLD
jgi:hypothetical protein